MKSVYFFGNKKAEATTAMKNIVGGKGANLAEMTNLGIPVPPGFTISTDECRRYNEGNKTILEDLIQQINENLIKVEQVMGLKFGDVDNPLLFSVRSGARVSMPGMMDTVLNLGLNDETVKGLSIQSKSERFAYDSYRRFIQMFSNVVLGLDHSDFEKLLSNMKKDRNVKEDHALTGEDLKELVVNYKSLLEKKNVTFPQEPKEQLKMAVGAVFNSWDADRAIKYRKINDIPGEWGTAVNVQAMVYGNLGETSGTGVAFTRNPSTGEKKFFGEFLMNAQGEDVVAGIRTPLLIDKLKAHMPQVYSELEDIYQTLEKHFKDMQDLEFTIQDQTLYLLQTRNGKRTATPEVLFDVLQDCQPKSFS